MFKTTRKLTALLPNETIPKLEFLNKIKISVNIVLRSTQQHIRNLFSNAF